VIKLETILVPLDFSSTALAAYEYAVGLCAETGARLIALHVLPAPYAESVDLVLLRREAEEAAQAMIESLDPPPSQSIIEQGVAHDTILKVAEAVGATLIVIGTHGHSGVRRLMLGSVAENVLRHAPCPVLTVRSPD
jgi:universal stress protein A